MTTPSGSKARYAFSTVWKLTPRLDARLRADGSRSPTLARARAISSRTCSRIWWWTGLVSSSTAVMNIRRYTRSIAPVSRRRCSRSPQQAERHLGSVESLDLGRPERGRCLAAGQEGGLQLVQGDRETAPFDQLDELVRSDVEVRGDPAHQRRPPITGL